MVREYAAARLAGSLSLPTPQRTGPGPERRTPADPGRVGRTTGPRALARWPPAWPSEAYSGSFPHSIPAISAATRAAPRVRLSS